MFFMSVVVTLLCIGAFVFAHLKYELNYKNPVDYIGYICAVIFCIAVVLPFCYNFSFSK